MQEARRLRFQEGRPWSGCQRAYVWVPSRCEVCMWDWGLLCWDKRRSSQAWGSQCLCMAEFLRRWSRSGKRRGGVESGGGEVEEQMTPEGNRVSSSNVSGEWKEGCGRRAGLPCNGPSGMGLAISEINARWQQQHVESSSRFGCGEVRDLTLDTFLLSFSVSRLGN